MAGMSPERRALEHPSPDPGPKAALVIFAFTLTRGPRPGLYSAEVLSCTGLGSFRTVRCTLTAGCRTPVYNRTRREKCAAVEHAGDCRRVRSVEGRGSVRTASTCCVGCPLLSPRGSAWGPWVFGARRWRVSRNCAQLLGNGSPPQVLDPVTWLYAGLRANVCPLLLECECQHGAKGGTLSAWGTSQFPVSTGRGHSSASSRVTPGSQHVWPRERQRRAEACWGRTLALRTGRDRPSPLCHPGSRGGRWREHLLLGSAEGTLRAVMCLALWKSA